MLGRFGLEEVLKGFSVRRKDFEDFGCVKAVQGLGSLNTPKSSVGSRGKVLCRGTCSTNAGVAASALEAGRSALSGLGSQPGVHLPSLSVCLSLSSRYTELLRKTVAS